MLTPKKRPHQPIPTRPAIASRIALWLRAWTLIGFLVIGPCCLLNRAAEPDSAPTLANLPDTINIHHQPQYCPLCHQGGTNSSIPFEVRPLVSLKTNCRCHYNTPADLRHPTDVAIPETMRAKIEAAFPVSNGKIDCVSCHSFKVLCAIENPHTSSLRGAPYLDRTTFCYRCHDEKLYERLNPHNQLDAAGKIVVDKCLFCHTQKPNETNATFASIKLIGGLEMLCQGCHNISDKHPAGKSHFVRPTLEYQVRMRQLENQYGIVLPLDEKGKLTCITCHNPHEAGVIPKALAGAKGAGEKLRQRLPKVLCAECHWHPISDPKR